MGLSIKNDEVEALARALAEQEGVGITTVIHRALKDRAERNVGQPSLWERLAPLRAEIAAMPDSGLKADRAFYDELSGEA